MSHGRILLATLFVGLLAACGGPTTSPPPPDPTVTTVSPGVAPRGDTITVTGEDFGTTAGSLTVGGVESTITTWTDTQIEATVAGGTPDGWQEVVLTTPDGTDNFSPFFVGVEYTGVATDLQAFLDGLDKGTAVLLQAQTYDLSASPDGLILDNHGLYGRGATQTVLQTPTATGMVVLADFGESLTIADMAMAGDSIGFYHGTVVGLLGTLDVGALAAARLGDAAAAMVERTIELPSQSTVVDLSSMAVPSQSGFDLGSTPSPDGLALPTQASPAITIDAFAETPSFVLEPADVATPRITLQGVEYSEVAGGSFGVPMMVLPTIDLVLVDTTLALDNSVAVLFSARDVTLDNVSVDAAVVQLLSYTGALTIVDSVVESASDVLLAAESGLVVDGSTVRALDGRIEIVGAATAMVGGSIAPTGGPIEIVGSTIDALDADLADATALGTLEIMTQFAPIMLTDNVRIRTHDSTAVVTLESAIGEADITLTGNTDVRVGVFKSDDAVNFRAASLQLVTVGGPGLPDAVTLDGNTILTTALLGIVAGSGGQPGFVKASANTLTAGDGQDNGVIQVIAGTPGWLEFDGNALEADGVIQLAAPDLAGKSVSLTDNVVSAIGDASPQLAMQFADGSCSVSNNTFEAEDVGADAPSVLVIVCLGLDPLVDVHTFDGNVLSASGGGTSVMQVGVVDGGLNLSSNQFAAESTLQMIATGASGSIASNTIAMAAGLFVVTGDAASDLTLDANVVTYENVAAYGLALSGIGVATVTNNSLTDLGTPAANAVALAFVTSGAPITLDASGNTFTNFSRALYIADQNGAAWGIDATIQNNVFDFTIDAAPKVAELNNVADEIDARFNQWGANTVVATVQGFVTESGDTAVQGGSILLDPITVP
ncbi:MAG: IPT/TIG domain-containing protein [Trueperaceae bacterium]